MDRKRTNLTGEGHDEPISAHLPKRSRTTHTDWDNGPRELQTPTATRDQYTIAWICALSLEMAAARAMLDEIHEPLPRITGDSNAYTLGRIGQHNIVIACLPEGQYGTVNAASVVVNAIRSFASTRAVLMVGIGGGVPSQADIRLGDVVVGTRVMQYDLGKIVGAGQIQSTGIWKQPHTPLSTAVSSLRAKHDQSSSQIPVILKERAYSRPEEPDQLFPSTYDHISSTSSCVECDLSKLLPRSRRKTHDPQIHYGAIASGNQVMRSAIQRDLLAQQLKVICFEMEAAGLMGTDPPCLPIRGICDYSDSHKNKAWQPYAAAAAAAYAKEFVMELPVFTEDRPRVAHSPKPGKLSLTLV